MMEVHGDFIFDPYLVLYLPLHELDGASFMSKDAYGHLCTVTGALWRPNGRYFDGSDDQITIPSVASIDNIFDGGGTVLAWINAASDGESNLGMILNKAVLGGWYFHTREESAGNVKLHLQIIASNNRYFKTAANTSINTNHFVGVTYDADSASNTPIFYRDGNTVAIDASNSPAGTRTTDAGDSLYIGDNSMGNVCFDGYISEVFVYSRVLAPLEIQHIYLATKWRYR